MTHAIKFVGPDTVEGLAIPFGSPDDRDLDGEYFTAATDLALDWFATSGRPALCDHGFDDAHKLTPVGRQTEYEAREEGIWAQVQLDKHARYRKTIDQMVEAGSLGYSSGAISHLVTKSAGGEIVRWPWVELSLTGTPASPAALGVHYVKSLAAIEAVQAVGADITPMVKALVAALDTSSDDSGSESFDDQTARVASELGEYLSRARKRYETRAAKADPFSAANREGLVSLDAQLAAVVEFHAEVQDFIKRTDPDHRADVQEAVAKAYRVWASTALI